MAHIHLVDPAKADGLVAKVFADVEDVRGAGRVSNLLKGYAAHPALLQANWERMKVLLANTLLSKKLKESLMLALAEINGCTY